MTTGNFPLQDAGALPNATVAFPGEVWSRGKASGTIRPGAAVIPVNSGGKQYLKTASGSDASDRRLGIAFRPVEIPDVNTGPNALGPNEIVNTNLSTHDYVRVYYSGAFHLTLIKATAYVPGDLIGWDDDEVPQTGKTGVGCWKKVSSATDALFEVQEFRTTNDAGTEGILTVRSLRTQS